MLHLSKAVELPIKLPKYKYKKEHHLLANDALSNYSF